MIPWKGQPVRPVVRVLAWIFVVISMLTYLSIILFVALDVIQGKTMFSDFLFLNSGASGFFEALFFVFGPLYMSILFGHVAIKGKAPSTWLPWQ